MIDFSNYTIYQQQAMNEVLHDLVDRLEDYGVIWDYLREMRAKSDTQLTISVDAQFYQQALDAASAPPAEDPSASAPPAEEPDDLQALVDTLSRCSVQLAALALAEDKHFAECSQMDSFMKLTVLRNANRSIIDLLADIRDHYDGLH